MKNEKVNEIIRKACPVLLIVILLVTAVIVGISVAKIFQKPVEDYTISAKFYAPAEAEDYSEAENTKCEVTYLTADEAYEITLTYAYEEWEALDRTAPLQATVTVFSDGAYAAFVSEPTAKELRAAYRTYQVNGQKETLNLALALTLSAVALGIMIFFGKHFTTYEKIWFLSILVLASVFAILFPEEDCNGISGILIMALYLADTLLNILCELLISKQSKWNFLVSVFVELTEIAICLVLSYRFATMATTLFFWLPIDIVSFLNWHKHPDEKEEELTAVRRLHGWQEVLILVGIALWTLGVGKLLSGINFGTELFGGNQTMETVVCYLDACASAVGVANGLFIFFRIREQWIAWYLCALLEAAINILSGQYVLLVLKAGYITNTTYGYLKWSNYINSHTEIKKSIL